MIVQEKAERCSFLFPFPKICMQCTCKAIQTLHFLSIFLCYQWYIISYGIISYSMSINLCTGHDEARISRPPLDIQVLYLSLINPSCCNRPSLDSGGQDSKWAMTCDQCDHLDASAWTLWMRGMQAGGGLVEWVTATLWTCDNDTEPWPSPWQRRSSNSRHVAHVTKNSINIPLMETGRSESERGAGLGLGVCLSESVNQ